MHIMNTTRSNYTEISSESSDVFYHVHKIIDSKNGKKMISLIRTTFQKGFLIFQLIH